MSFSREQLQAELAALEQQADIPSRYVIAFSGGLDSTVLAHALCTAELGVPLVAVHVDHGLQEDSVKWRTHCEAFANSLGVEFQCLTVCVDLDSGKGPEAAAREARYAALHDVLRPGDWLLSAHHREDQAETLLLNLIRGSGPAGIAGIGAIRRFGPGWLARPLLNVDQAGLSAYAASHGLEWVDDPSNADRRYDRNFLRHDVMPVLRSRWPDVALRLQRSASHAGEAAGLLADLAKLDFDALGAEPGRLPVDGLQALTAGRRRNLLRYTLREMGLSTPSALQLERVLDEVLPARPDAQPHVAWPGASVRRYRNGLYLLPEHLAAAPMTMPIGDANIALGEGLGELRFEEDADSGLSAHTLEQGLRLDIRKGGEEFRPYGQGYTRKLKKLLQEEGIVPWMRDRLPLLYAGEQLVAVGDIWMAADAVSSPGVAVRWTGRPALY